MNAIAVRPGESDSLGLVEISEPEDPGALLVETIAIGVCGTDIEIIERGHGIPPPDSPHLVLGHESLGRVVSAPAGCGFSTGDYVSGIVRRPDPEPCACCAAGNWDMCLNGRYTERGIKSLDGFAAERFSIEPTFAVRVDLSLGLCGVLVEPTSIVAKAWRRIDEFTELNCLERKSVLVTGAGPIGLLAALLGRQRDLEVHVLDRVEHGPKPELVRRLGATYHSSMKECPSTDVAIECTGASALFGPLLGNTNANAVVCLAGVSEHGTETLDVGALNRELVLENDVVFGSVNAHPNDYATAVENLLEADRQWLEDVIRRRVPLSAWSEAYEKHADDVKTIIVFGEE